MSIIQFMSGGGDSPATPSSDDAEEWGNLQVAMPCNVSYGFRDVSHKIKGYGSPKDVISRIPEYSNSSQFYGTAPIMGPHLGGSQRANILGLPAFNTDAFTIEAYLKFPDLSSTQCGFFYNHSDDNTGFQILVTGDAFSIPKRGIYVSGGAGADVTHTGDYVIPEDTWFHLRVTRYDSGLRIFVNGTNQNSFGGSMTTSWSHSSGVALFASYDSTWDTCQMQDFRVYQGIASISNFTPPGAMFI
jgi:hypothetical protein